MLVLRWRGFLVKMRILGSFSAAITQITHRIWCVVFLPLVSLWLWDGQRVFGSLTGHLVFVLPLLARFPTRIFIARITIRNDIDNGITSSYFFAIGLCRVMRVGIRLGIDGLRDTKFGFRSSLFESRFDTGFRWDLVDVSVCFLVLEEAALVRWRLLETS